MINNNKRFAIERDIEKKEKEEKQRKIKQARHGKKLVKDGFDYIYREKIINEDEMFI